jgi:hypothetical protein
MSIFFRDDKVKCKLSGQPSPSVLATEGELEVTHREVPFKMPVGAPTWQPNTPPIVYLAHFSDWATFNGLAVKDWLVIMFQLLSGAARAWMRIRLEKWEAESATVTLSTFRDAFLHRFLGADWPFQVRAALDSFQFSGNLHQFLSRYQELDAFVVDRCDADRYHHVLSKLPDEVQRFVRAKTPTTFAEAVDAAFAWEQPPLLGVDELLGSQEKAVSAPPLGHPPTSALPPSSAPAGTSEPLQPVVHPDPSAMDIDVIVAALSSLGWGSGGRGGKGGKGGKGRSPPPQCYNCWGWGHVATNCPSKWEST